MYIAPKWTSRQIYVSDHACFYSDGDNIRALKADGSHESPAKEIPSSGPKESSKADTDPGKEKGKSDTKDTVEESVSKASDETGGGEQEKSENSKDDGKTKEEKEEASKKLQELLEIQRKAFLEAKKPDQVVIIVWLIRKNGVKEKHGCYWLADLVDL